MSKVSIIVPVYNGEKYLKKCLDSVINQTLEDIEIVCVNDCSTDKSLVILQEYAEKDKRVKIIELFDILAVQGTLKSLLWHHSS